MEAITQLGLDGGIAQPYGSFDGKEAPVLAPFQTLELEARSYSIELLSVSAVVEAGSSAIDSSGGTSMAQTFDLTRTPIDDHTIALDATNYIPSGRTISSCTITATDERGDDVTASILQTAAGCIVGSTVLFRIRNAAARSLYRLSFPLVLDNGETAHAVAYIKVFEDPA